MPVLGFSVSSQIDPACRPRQSRLGGKRLSPEFESRRRRETVRLFTWLGLALFAVGTLALPGVLHGLAALR